MMYDYVDGVMFEEEFVMLEVFWQFFVDGLFDYVGIGEVDQCFGFVDDYVVEYCQVGGNVVVDWVG